MKPLHIRIDMYRILSATCLCIIFGTAIATLRESTVAIAAPVAAVLIAETIQEAQKRVSLFRIILVLLMTAGAAVVILGHSLWAPTRALVTGVMFTSAFILVLMQIVKARKGGNVVP